MSNDAASVLAQARKDIGYWRHDDPQTGTKFGRWYAQGHGSYYGQNGVPYCAMAVSYWFAMAGAECAGLPEAYCPYILSDARAAGAVLADKTAAQPGDVVLFDWDGGVVDHVGVVEKNCGSYVQTIEGNTTYNGKSESVGRRTRAWSSVAAVVRPSWGSGGGAQGPSVPAAGAVTVDGDIGPDSTMAWQRQLGCDVVDGVISGQDVANRPYVPSASAVEFGSGGSVMVGKVQRFLRSLGYDVKVDDQLGPETVTGIQRFMRERLGYRAHAIDGVLGFYTACNVQNAINAGAWF